jgi:hypothetical protein
MPDTMTNVADHMRRPIQGKSQRTQASDACPRSGRPITIALTKMLNHRLSDDLRCQTYAELIAKVLICKAVKGDIQAIREITDRVEGKVSEAGNYKSDEPAEFRVIYEDPIPRDWQRDIHSSQPEVEQIEPA